MPLIVRKLSFYVKEKDHFLDQGVGKKIELELNFKKCNWGEGQFGQNFCVSELGPLASYCEHDNKIPLSADAVNLRELFATL